MIGTCPRSILVKVTTGGAAAALLLAHAGCHPPPRSGRVLAWAPDVTPLDHPVRTSFAWEVPEVRVTSLDGIPTGSPVPRYDIRHRVEQLRRDLLSDEGEAPAKSADILLRVVSADFVPTRDYECSNDQTGSEAVLVALSIEARIGRGEPIKGEGFGQGCSSPSDSTASRDRFDACLDESVTLAFANAMRGLGAHLRKREETVPSR